MKGSFLTLLWSTLPCRKEDLNLRFVGVTEHDYEWLTGQIVEIANR
jgi:hypothetical protein